MSKSPFKFLDSYTIEDRNIFFGRDQEITELYRRVFESKILLVYGVSGTGKSSLVNCGLASRFDDSDWLPLNVRRGSNIVESLDVAINKQAITPLKKEQAISEKLQSIYLDHFKPVFLIFDQFEELFIFGSQEEKTDFIRLLKEIVDSKVQCRIILVIREEFLAGITEFEYDLPEIFSNRFRVEKMKRSNAIHAIEGPCRVYNIGTEPGFSEELIDKLCPAGNEIELTFLQIYLDRIFRIAGAEKNEDEKLKFSKDLLTKAGSVSDLLGQFLEEQIMEFDDPDTGMAILKSFISVQGTKRQMNEPEILDAVKAFGTEIDEPDLIKYLTKFVDLRILRERDESGHFELRHDALASKIYEKFTAIEKDIIEVRQFIENAFSVYEKRGKLLTADDLMYIAPYEDKLFLNRNAGQFIIDSKNFLVKSQRRRRRILTTFAITMFLILTFFTGWALNERKKAVKEKEVAEIQKENALAANDKTIKAETEALKEKNRALDNEKSAIKAREEAENSKIKAVKAESAALREKDLALIEQRKANTALQAKIEAEKRLEEAAKDFVMSPDVMNILYKGIENPISFAIPGISSGSIIFRPDVRCKIRAYKDKVSIKPNTTGILNITLLQIKGIDTIELGTRSFKVRNLPMPIPEIAGKNGGYILKDTLVNSNGIKIISSITDFDISYEILGYKVICKKNKINQSAFIGYVSKNEKFEDLKYEFEKISHNQQLIFEDITVVGPDSLVRNLGNLSLKVIERIPWDDPDYFKSQIMNLIYQKDWEVLKKVAIENIDKYYMGSEGLLNDIAWDFYSRVSDTLALKQALKWAERSVRLSKGSPGYMDTYASLLFKLGNFDEAERVEQEAIAKAKARNEPFVGYEMLLKKIHDSR